MGTKQNLPCCPWWKNENAVRITKDLSMVFDSINYVIMNTFC